MGFDLGSSTTIGYSDDGKPIRKRTKEYMTQLINWALEREKWCFPIATLTRKTNSPPILIRFMMGKSSIPKATTILWIRPAAHSGFGTGFYTVRSLSNGIQSVAQLPQTFKLSPNYPNPFNSETVIPLELPQRSMVKIELFNISGQSLGVIFQGIQEAGWRKIRYNASELASGLYFCRMTAEGLERSGSYSDIGKLLLLK